MIGNKNYREQFVKKFIARTIPRLKKIVHKQKSDLSFVDTEPIMVVGQVVAEIDTSISYLKLVPDLITSHSSYYEKKGFSRVNQHRKKIEGYLDEIYIIKERVVRMLNLLKKYHLSKGLQETSKEILIIESLKKSFLAALSGILEIRGGHTHQYSYQDKELYRLELLDLTYHNMDYPLEVRKGLFEDLKFDLRLDRKYWKKRIQKDTNTLLEKLDEIYFKIDEYKLIDKIK